MKWQKWLTALLSVLALLCILSLVYIKVCNIRVFNLQSTSMTPAIQEGSMLLNEHEEFENIKVGDVITYKLKGRDLYVTHRVIKIDEIQSKILCKGDANKVNDEAYIDYHGQYQGTLILCIPYLGNVISFLHGDGGKLIIFLTTLLLIGSIMYDLYKRKIKEG